MNVFQYILQGHQSENPCQILKSENRTNVIFVAENFLSQPVSESIRKEKAFVRLKWLSNVTEHQSKNDNPAYFTIQCGI